MTRTQLKLTLGGVLVGLFAGALGGYCVGLLLSHDECGVIQMGTTIASSIVGIPIGGVVFGLIGYRRGRVTDPKVIQEPRKFQCPECGGTVVASCSNGIVKDCPHCSRLVRMPAADTVPLTPPAEQVADGKPQNAPQPPP